MLLFLTLENRLVATSGIRAASLDTTRWRSPSDCCQQSVHFTDRRTSSTILTGFSLFSTSHVGREHAMLVQQGACPPITPRRGEMEITKGALEGISRPASGERFRAGSRVSRASVPEGGRADSSPTSLEVLSCDVAEDHSLVLEDPCASGDVPHESQNSFDIKELVGKNEDPQLQKAINKMKSLDKTLAIKISYEKEVRKQGRELHQKLWQELLESKTDGALERPDEAENTRLFLALTPNSLPESVTNEEVGGTIFSTQIPDKEYLKHINKECDTDNPSTKGSSEMVQERREDPAHSRASKGSVAKDRQKRNFVKKNIELASGGGHVPMTLEDRQRLSELLKDIQEDDEDTNRSAHQQATTSSCSVLIQAGEGYSPEPLQLDQLVQIDARLHTLLPVEDFLSVRSPYPDHISPQPFATVTWQSGHHGKPPTRAKGMNIQGDPCLPVKKHSWKTGFALTGKCLFKNPGITFEHMPVT
uniref:Fibrous sheath-interacting protein 1 n=1 Tax=Denticeps clupeoides TaxID=299321 RepID=A0AAY4BK77_9TELE